MSQKGIAVIGAGGHAKVVIRTLLASGKVPEAIFDANSALWGNRLMGIPILGHPNECLDQGYRHGILAIGDNRGRERLATELELTWVSAVHPHAWVDETASMGPGTVVFAGALIQADTRLGHHVIVNTGATIDHDCLLGDFTHLAPGGNLAGDVCLGEGALMGIGSSAIPGISIGAWATVGAGAAVIGDIDPRRTAVGVPARELPSGGG